MNKLPTGVIGERRLIPIHPSAWGSSPFRVWAIMPAFTEDSRPYKCTAAFRYLLEAVDYIEACTKRERTVWLQSPTGVQEYPAILKAQS
jgi:hypothetical protein